MCRRPPPAWPTIPTLISTGKVKKAEIAVIPELLDADGEVVALNAQYQDVRPGR